jgi:wyosine [tRNA(Phe)-imidazoG37] synthetase (radical SAM superfamily)
MRRLDFTDHRRSLDDNRYVYAVVSRRVGALSIGINLNPDKVCNFDCPYCQVDRRVPSGSGVVDLDRLDEELDHLLGWVADGSLWDHAPFDTAPESMRRVGDISFAGDGEPTSAGEFAGAVERVIEARARFGLGDVRLSLLTNATLFQRDTVREGLDMLHGAGGEVWAKLDAGTEAWFHKVDGTQFPFQRVLANIDYSAGRYNTVIQSMFHTFDGVGPTDAEVQAWVGRLRDVLDKGGLIRHVQVYSVARRPSEDTVGRLPDERLEWIAAQARALGLDVAVYPGVDWA